MPDAPVPANPTVKVPARARAGIAARSASVMQLLRLPVARQIGMLVGIAVAVALGVAIVLWSRGPTMGLLYTGLAPKDASDIVQALQGERVHYQLENNGTSVFVPAASIDALRLRLASQGLPQGNASSVPASQPDSMFGMSDADDAARHRALLEQSLERTIASLQSIQGARVHLALPKPSAFIRDDGQPSASVMVTLYQGRQLAQSQVAAIVHLVAASVPNLDPSRVSVIDQQGQLLTSDGNPQASIDNQRMQMAARVEQSYAQRVEHILAPLVGANHVRAQVYVDLNFSDSRSASETYGKDKQALQSEQVSSEMRRDGSAGGGVPGALSNQPPVTAQQPTAANPAAKGGDASTASTASQDSPTQSSNQATRNFAVDRTIRYTNDPAGDIKRLSVAVIVDNREVTAKGGKATSVPLGKAELAQLVELTKSAVGFDANRGDVVSVVNEPFRGDAGDTATPANTPFWQRPGVMDLIKQGLGVLAALLLAFGLLRPLLRNALRTTRVEPVIEPQALPGSGPAPGRVDVTVAGPVDPAAPVAKAPPADPARLGYEQKVGAARRAAAEHPAQVAQIVKSWMTADAS